MRISTKLFAIISIAILAASCAGSSSSSSSNSSVSHPAKYIFYFIGDGMAAAQVQLAEAALSTPEFRSNFAIQSGSESPAEELFIKSLSTTGLATSFAANRYITDSAAAGTALATGSKTDVGVISQDVDGNNLQTIAEAAKAKGMKVGIVSSVSLDHATPASFYAHTASRSNYTSISDQLLTSGFDYFGGGYIRLSSRARSEECDMATADASFREVAKEKGFRYATTREEFDNLDSSVEQPVIATLDMLANAHYSGDGFALPYTIDLNQYGADDRITLAEFTQKGVELLENKDGFFMMVEGGKIDWACHANDAASTAYETVAFDQAIGVAVAFAAKHPKETLIVVTGDHDCGGLTLGFAGTNYETSFDLMSNAKISYQLFAAAVESKIAAGESFTKLLSYACEQFGFTTSTSSSIDNNGRIAQTMELSPFEVKMLREAYTKSATKKLNERDNYLNAYGGYDPFTTTCTSILNNKSGIEFASYSHTAVPVMVFASGANAELFSGYYDNTDIAKKIAISAAL